MKNDAASNRWSFRSFLVAIVGMVLWLISEVSLLLPVNWSLDTVSMFTILNLLAMVGLAPLGIIFGILARKHRNRHADWAILTNVVLLLIHYLMILVHGIIDWIFLLIQ